MTQPHLQPSPERIAKIERNTRFVMALEAALKEQQEIASDTRYSDHIRLGMNRVIQSIRKVLDEHVE